MSQFDFDLFVIGGGSGGVRAGRLAASLGKRVAIALTPPDPPPMTKRSKS